MGTTSGQGFSGAFAAGGVAAAGLAATARRGRKRRRPHAPARVSQTARADLRDVIPLENLRNTDVEKVGGQVCVADVLLWSFSLTRFSHYTVNALWFVHPCSMTCPLRLPITCAVWSTRVCTVSLGGTYENARRHLGGF